MKKKEFESNCCTCKHYNECPMTGFESCKLEKEIPTSKNPCGNHEELKDIN